MKPIFLLLLISTPLLGHSLITEEVNPSPCQTNAELTPGEAQIVSMEQTLNTIDGSTTADHSLLKNVISVFTNDIDQDKRQIYDYVYQGRKDQSPGLSRGQYPEYNNDFDLRTAIENCFLFKKTFGFSLTLLGNASFLGVSSGVRYIKTFARCNIEKVR